MNRASSPTGWVRNPDGTMGWTWNPITGCLNHVKGMCKGGGFPCYAYRLAHGRLKERYKANINVAPVSLSSHPSAWASAVNSNQLLQTLDPFYPRFWPERLKELIPDVIAGREKGIFICDMSDLFGIGIPEEWTRQILNYIEAWPEHRFYLLTKQPQNLIKFSPFPDNCWVGVTATNRSPYSLAIYFLGKIEASVKFISFEPLLGEVMVGWFNPQTWENKSESQIMTEAGINWVIIGAQTKPTVYPKIEGVQEIVEAADKAGIPVFLKDNLRPLLCSKLNGKDVIESHNLWAFKYFKLRQEMPD